MDNGLLSWGGEHVDPNAGDTGSVKGSSKVTKNQKAGFRKRSPNNQNTEKP